MHGFLKQSTATQERLVGPFVDDTDFKTLETGLTIANTDVKLSKNGAAGVNKNSGGGTHRNNGMYSLTFDATDTNTVGQLKGSIAVSGALVVVFDFTVLEEAVYDALFAASAVGPVLSTSPPSNWGTLLISPGGQAAADMTHIHGSGLSESSAGRLAGNFGTFYDNADAATSRVVDDIDDAEAIYSHFTSGSNEDVFKATGFSTHSAADVWTAGTRTLTAAANITSDGSAIAVSSGVVDSVTLVATTTTNTDMRGTDSASTHSAADVWTSVTRTLTAATNVTSDGSAITMSSSGVVGTVNTVNTTTTNTDMRGTDNAFLATNAPTNFPSLVISGAGIVEADMVNIHGTALQETTPGNLAKNFDNFYDNADSLTSRVVDDIDDAEAIYAHFTTGSNEDVFKATGFSTHSAADVWTTGGRTLTSAANITSTGGTITVDSGRVASDMVYIHGGALTETTGDRLATNFSTFYDNADADTTQVVDDVGSGGGTVDANIVQILGTAVTETNGGDVAKSVSYFFDVNPTTTQTVDDVGGGGGGGGDWTTDEKNQIRYRLQLDGTTAAPAAHAPSNFQVTVPAAQTDMQTVIETNNLDHLLKVAVTDGDVTNGSVFANIVDNAATPSWANYDNTTMSMKAGYDDALTVQALVDGVWDELQSGHTTPGTFGYLIDQQISAVASSDLQSILGYQLTETNANDLGRSFAAFFDVNPTTLKTVDDVGGSGGGGGCGTGSELITITVKRVDDTPLDGVNVELSTDAGKTNVTHRGTTDTFGQVQFNVDPGFYYVWRQLAGEDLPNPETITVVAT